jgi:regulator of sirC expression with transglutaminase-like and TPR domain
MTVPAPSVRSRFAALVARPEPDVDLALGALLIAAEEYPQLVAETYLRRLDLLTERVRDRLGDETAGPVALQEISRILFENEGLRGNTAAYYDPRNSFLNDVLDRRLGTPPTLSIVYLEVGWRLELPLAGVNFPGHFLVRYDGEAVKLLVDPFQGGEIRFEDEAQDLLDRVYGGAVRLQESFLRPASKKDILVRLLANLKSIYQNAHEDVKALQAVERILLIRPEAPDELRDRGFLLARVGRGAEAAADLRRYLDALPHAPDAERVRMMLRELQSKS